MYRACQSITDRTEENRFRNRNIQNIWNWTWTTDYKKWKPGADFSILEIKNHNGTEKICF